MVLARWIARQPPANGAVEHCRGPYHFDPARAPVEATRGVRPSVVALPTPRRAEPLAKLIVET